MSINKPLLLSLLLWLLPNIPAQANTPNASASLPAAPATEEEARAQQDTAAAMRREANQKRSEAESIRTRDDLACQEKFLVNACRNKVRSAYVENMKVVRQLEIDANQIDRTAKSRILELEYARKQTPAPGAEPLPATSTPARTPTAPTGSPLQSAPAVKIAPSPSPSPQAEARQKAILKNKIAEAERARADRQAEATDRAAKARADAERYAQREREYAEKKAKRAAQSQVDAAK